MTPAGAVPPPPLGAPPPSAAVHMANAVRESSLAEVRKAVVGQDEALELMLVGLIAGGHVLLEGVPGTAKRLIAKSLAKSVSAEFKRIQFTPHMMPAHIIGTTVIEESEGGAKTTSFRKGPIFANIVLADEVNRATPKRIRESIDCWWPLWPIHPGLAAIASINGPGDRKTNRTHPPGLAPQCNCGNIAHDYVPRNLKIPA